MKRMLSLALVLLLALSLYAGCGGNNTQNNTQTGNQTTEGDGGADGKYGCKNPTDKLFHNFVTPFCLIGGVRRDRGCI